MMLQAAVCYSMKHCLFIMGTSSSFTKGLKNITYFVKDKSVLYVYQLTVNFSVPL